MQPYLLYLLFYKKEELRKLCRVEVAKRADKDIAIMDARIYKDFLVVNPITAYSYGFFFNNMILDQALDPNDGPGVKLSSTDWCLILVFG